MQCPFKNDFECPEHNKKHGCAWWLEAKEGNEATASLSGCAMVLTPMLLAQNINMGACVAKEVSQAGAEISAMRSERVKADAINHAFYLQMSSLTPQYGHYNASIDYGQQLLQLQEVKNNEK